MVIGPHSELVRCLIRILGLPRSTISFSLHCTVGEAVSVNCEFYPEQDSVEITSGEYFIEREVLYPW